MILWMFVSKVETDYKSVVIVGPKNIIDDLTSSDVYIECDLSKNVGNTGSVIIKGAVKSNNYKTIWGTGDCDITIKVENS